MEISDLKKIILESDDIGITFHVSPDGDSLGSGLSLYSALKKINKNAFIICNDEIPEVYNFLPGLNFITKEVPDCLNLMIVLDCGNLERICSDIKIGGKYKVANIDHHKSNDNYGDFNYIDTKASATGEIVYALIESLDISLDENIAINLYTSILTDTGAFRFSNTTGNTLHITGNLISKVKFDFSDIYRRIYFSKDYKRIKLYGMVISSMKLIFGGRAVIMYITKDMLKKLDTKLSDTQDIINIGMEIDSVDTGVLIKETDEGLKVSLRSKYLVDVSKIAETFGGGGHISAAGLTLKTTIEEGERLLTEALLKEFHAGNNKSL